MKNWLKGCHFRDASEVKATWKAALHLVTHDDFHISDKVLADLHSCEKTVF